MKKLIFIAFLSTFLWLAEIFYHGWHHLTWLRYFHWAIPVSMLFFIVWATFTLPEIERFRGAIGMLFASIVGYATYSLVLSHFFYRGNFPPYSSEWSRFIHYFASFMAYPMVCLTPLFVFLVLMVCRIKLSKRCLLVSTLVFSMSPFFGYLVMTAVFSMLLFFGYPVMATRHDVVIHLVKTGSVIPFMVLGLGMLFVGEKKEASSGATHSDV